MDHTGPMTVTTQTEEDSRVIHIGKATMLLLHAHQEGLIDANAVRQAKRSPEFVEYLWMNADGDMDRFATRIREAWVVLLNPS